MSMVWLDPDLISFIPLYSNTKPGCKAPVTCPDLSISVSLETMSTPAQSPRFCSSCLSCLHHHVIPESRSFLIYNGCFLYGRLQLPDLFRHGFQVRRCTEASGMYHDTCFWTKLKEGTQTVNDTRTFWFKNLQAPLRRIPACDHGRLCLSRAVAARGTCSRNQTPPTDQDT